MTERHRGARGVRVGRAKHGRGVFAKQPYLAGELIARVGGRVIQDPSYGSDYCMELDGRLSLEPSRPFRFMNHSCRPNCELVQYELQDDEDNIVGSELWVATLVDLATDDELTIDYAWPADAAIPCGCMAEDCRGWIVAEEEMEALAARLAVETQPALEQRPARKSAR